MNDPEVSLPTLLTITRSHCCEKARRVLERAEIEFREDRHAPGLHGLFVRGAGAAALVRRAQNTPAGAFCLRVCRDERR